MSTLIRSVVVIAALIAGSAVASAEVVEENDCGPTYIGGSYTGK